MLQDGRIPKDHDRDTYWTVPPKDGTKKNSDLYEVLELGLMCNVLGKEIWENEDLADIQLIIDVDNQDQMTAMADHEIHLFNRIRLATEEQHKVDSPLLLFERVYEKIKKSMGPFSRKDCIHLYNCASKLPGPYGDLLIKFHFFFVNPSALKVMPEKFGLAAKLDDKLVVVKLALLFQCYMCSDELYETIGLMHYANAIQKPKIDKLAEHPDYL